VVVKNRTPERSAKAAVPALLVESRSSNEPRVSKISTRDAPHQHRYITIPKNGGGPLEIQNCRRVLPSRGREDDCTFASDDPPVP
jgi:hypothetical protein